MERQVLSRMARCLPIPLPTQCFMNYSLGVSRSQQYMDSGEPLLAPFNLPERTHGWVTDVKT